MAEDLSWLTALRDWLRRAVHEDARRQRSIATSATAAPFSVDRSAPRTPILVRRDVHSATRPLIEDEAAVYLEMLVKADGNTVAGHEVGARLNDPRVRVGRLVRKKSFPTWVLKYMEIKRATGGRLRTGRWRNSAVIRP